MKFYILGDDIAGLHCDNTDTTIVFFPKFRIFYSSNELINYYGSFYIKAELKNLF